MRVILPSRRATDADATKSARVLLADHGALADYPGPVAILRRDGAVLAANRAAEAFSERLGLGPDNDLHPDIARAVRGGVATEETVTLTASTDAEEAEAKVAFVILPLKAGETALIMGRNMTLETSFRAALVDSRRRYKELVDISSDFCWETDAQGRFSFVSPRGGAGYDADELVGHMPSEFLIEPELDASTVLFGAREPVSEIDVWVRHADGREACLVASAIPVFAADGAWAGARGVCRDVTEERARDTQLARAQARERLLAHITRAMRDEIEPDRMLEVAAESTARALGAAGCRIYRKVSGHMCLAAHYGPDSGAADIDLALLARAGDEGGAVATQAGDHAVLCVATSYRQEINGGLCLIRGQQADPWAGEDRSLATGVAAQLGIAIAQINNHFRLEELSRTDGLTGLLNRRAFTEELNARIDRIGDGAAPGALFYVDLDNFKPVNDVLGHQKGDEALIAVSGLLASKTRPGDLVSRLGGDEFALWLERTDEDSAAGRAEDLLAGAGILDPYTGDPARPLGLSLGIAVHAPSSGEDAESLTKRADDAMYDVKHNGKAGYAIASPYGVGPVVATERRKASA